MPDYDLSRLSPRSFEQLVQSLAARVLGPGIVVFGDGPDGGREATFDRKVPFPTPDDNWDGYGVVQAKYRQRLGNTQQDGNWTVDQLKDELQKYTNPGSTLRKPDYFIYATNVVLTPAHEKGSKDRTIAVLEEFKKQSSLKEYAIWDYDQIRAFLDAYEDVRNAYSAFITPGDVLAKIISRLSPSPVDMYDTLVMFLEKELLSDECVNLEQAGHNVDERIPLATVFVDLPTHDESAGFRTQVLANIDVGIGDIDLSDRPGAGFIKDILAASSECLDPTSLGTTVISNDLDSSGPRESRGRFVLVGGPGQGKTTLTQFICQIFRTSIISGKPENTLAPEIKKALTTIQDHCGIEEINHSVVPRFPFKLILNDFAKALSNSSTSHVNSVLGYLSRQIRNRTYSDISANDLHRFLGLYPSVIIFDGLDEVPASSNRDQVLDAIRDFWVDASNANADILSIATTRPQGYNEDFSPLYYHHRQLAELSGGLGWHFAQRLAEVRYGTDEDRKQKVLGRLQRAFGDDSTTRLMRSPLQVTIMTALVDRIGQPPQVRWDLFNSYYDVIYLREVERSIPASIILRDYRPDIKAIHNQVGLLLQMNSERTGRTDAKLSRDRFVSLVEARLKAEGHTGEHLHALGRQIVEAASQRLVFLVEVESEQIGFEIRSLQEFMAAECLMDGADQNIRQRLDEIAPIPFWRNVFLFAAGKCFAERQELREPVHAICAALNEIDDDEIAGTYLAGSDLAIALLEEGSSRRQPRFESLLARIAIRALDTANPSRQTQLADVYESQLETIYQEDIKLRLTGGLTVKSFGAWNCLLRLVEIGIPWAAQVATEHWPANQEDQVRILQAITEPTKNHWATDKMLQLIPSTPVATFSRMYQSEPSRHWPEGHHVEPELEAAISLIRSRTPTFNSAVSVLNTGVSCGPVIRLTGSEDTVFQRLRHVEGWHSSWLVYKYAGDFLEVPSKESLAMALTSLAAFVYAESDGPTGLGRRNLPWPILACVHSCTSSQELLRLADKAAQGELGDVADWIAAETRWFDKGITGDDLLSMSDDRLPFDAKIGEIGFPPSISVLSAIIEPPGPEEPLEGVLDIFNDLPPGETRSLVADTVNWLIFIRSFGSSSDDLLTSPHLSVETLESLYRQVPSGSLIPLHMIVGLIGESIRELSRFFAAIKGKDFLFDSHIFYPHFTGESVKTLQRAYMALDEDDVFLPILAVLAENGHLAGQYVDIKGLISMGTPGEKLAALIITLSQETWRTDNSEQLLASAQGIGDLSAGDFARIVTTLETNRPTGYYFEKFVALLKELTPLEDYISHQRYVALLEDILRKRTSQFADSSKTCQFALPKGVVALLEK